MKTILTAIVLVICIGAKAQHKNAELKTRFLFTDGDSNASYDSSMRGFCMAIGFSDTLIIADTSIHFVKIGEQVFEIKRNVTLEPAQPKPPTFRIWDNGVDTTTPISIDTLPPSVKSFYKLPPINLGYISQ